MTTSEYYIVKVDDDGDVCACRVVDTTDGVNNRWVTTDQLDRVIADAARGGALGLENQGDDDISKWESARDALAAVMPEPKED